jgi:hypothetical protein
VRQCPPHQRRHLTDLLVQAGAAREEGSASAHTACTRRASAYRRSAATSQLLLRSSQQGQPGMQGVRLPTPHPLGEPVTTASPQLCSSKQDHPRSRQGIGERRSHEVRQCLPHQSCHLHDCARPSVSSPGNRQCVCQRRSPAVRQCSPHPPRQHPSCGRSRSSSPPTRTCVCQRRSHEVHQCLPHQHLYLHSCVRQARAARGVGSASTNAAPERCAGWNRRGRPTRCVLSRVRASPRTPRS